MILTVLQENSKKVYSHAVFGKLAKICRLEGSGNPLQCSWLENPRDGEPGGLTSLGSNRVGHD